jgi:hypothetical protein
MEEETTVSQETPADDTAAPSVSEDQTTSEVETAPADVSDQPTEEAKPRAEKRIHELSKRLKESEQRADYWERLNAPPVAPADVPESDVYSAEQIADVIMRKQQTQRQEESKLEANRELQKDITETLLKHPDLETNDKLSKTVFAYAQANNMRISDAADEIKSQIKANEEKVKKEVIASQSGRLGVTTPSGGRVSTGADKIDVDSMSEEEKSANWGKILQSYQK